MTLDEGYIKYRSDWTPGPPPDPELARRIATWRRPLFEAGLIGHYEDQGVGYGNISVRAAPRRGFLISGTQTGHLADTDEHHYALVTAYDIDANSVSCRGPVQASSEALTHAAIYELDDAITAVVHVHSRSLWRTFVGSLPTTSADIAYGTPQMARDFQRLYDRSAFADGGIAIMAGHEDGLVSIGHSLRQAATRILELKQTLDG